MGADSMDWAFRESGLKQWSKPVVTPNPMCQSGRDGDCYWHACPQLHDGEPEKSGRHCPLDRIFDMWCEEYGHDRR